MFKVTMGKGVHIKFANGWSISIQWGPGNYCDQRNSIAFDAASMRKAGENGSSTAEIAFFNPDGDMPYIRGHGDQVLGHCSPEDVTIWMMRCADGSIEEYTTMDSPWNYDED